MKLTRLLLFTCFAIPAAIAVAGWLPLWYDAPKRDNPNDPFVKRQNPSQIPPPLPAGSPTPTPTPVGACGSPTDSSTIATFESGTNGFAYVAAGGYTGGTALNSTTPACLGAKGLCGTQTWTHAGSPVKVGYSLNFASQDWTGKVLTVRVNFPAGMGAVGGKPYVKTTGYFYQAGAYVNAPVGGGWVTMTESMVGLTNPNDVLEVGVDLYSPATEADGSFTICIDAVDLQ